MKITILGAGSAYGSPMIFEQWGKLNADNPKNRRTRASALLEIEGKSILIDAGPDLREQINRNGVRNLDAVFITHEHYDHMSGIPELPRASKILGHGIEVYASSETMAGLKKCFGYLFEQKADAEPDAKKIIWKMLPDLGEFKAQGLKFVTAQLPHHQLHSSVFRYKNFAYVTDWQEMTVQTAEMLYGLDLLVIECNNGVETENNGHSNLAQIKEVMDLLKPKRVVLTHLSVRVDYDIVSQMLPSNCVLAYDGMELSL